MPDCFRPILICWGLQVMSMWKNNFWGLWTQKSKHIHPPRSVKPFCVEMFCFNRWRTEALVKSSRFQSGELCLLSVKLFSRQSRAWREHSRVWRWKLSLCLICISDPTDRSQMRPQRAPLKPPAGLPHHCQPVSVTSSYFPLSTDSSLIFPFR